MNVVKQRNASRHAPMKASEVERAREVWRRKFGVPPMDAHERAAAALLGREEYSGRDHPAGVARRWAIMPRWFLAWLDTRAAPEFAKGLAKSLVEDLGLFQKKYRQKAVKAVVKGTRQIERFKASHCLNFFQRSRFANTFWTLRDGGCPQDCADELTSPLVCEL